jgi:hypothetical protein
MKNGRGVIQGGRLSQILFYLYSRYLTKEALQGFGDLKRRGHVRNSYCDICRWPCATG